MDEGSVQTARAVLHTLADLAPSAEQRLAGLTIPTDWFRWLPASGAHLVARYREGDNTGPTHIAIDRGLGERLAKIDQLRGEGKFVRVGWLFVAGRMELPNGLVRRVFVPLVTVPVRVLRGPPIVPSASLVRAGDAEVTELVDDVVVRQELDARLEWGGGALDGMEEPVLEPALLSRLTRLAAFAKDTAAAAGLPATKLVPADGSPDKLMQGDELVIVAGVGVYTVHETTGLSRAASLRVLADSAVGEWTAFHSLYLDRSEADDLAPAPSNPRVESPYLLTPVQQEAVRRSRHDPVTLVSGAPGTGKSHAVAAIACDALAHGESVLLAAKSEATVDALLDLLERAPGPEPVVFGSSERREALAERLSAGQLAPATEDALAAATKRRNAAYRRRDALRQEVVDRLAAEALLADRDSDEVLEARNLAPGLFDPGADLPAVERLADAAATPTRGWWSRRRRRKDRRRLLAAAGALDDVSVEEVRSALAVARAVRISGDLVAAGGLDLGPEWEELRRLDDAARDATARWLAVESRCSRRLNRSTLREIAVLATALRSGRAARRQQLQQMNDERLTRGLPLWAGTLADIDDLLPPAPAAFDLVILDEASSIDQPLAAAALIRGARAVVVGDPRQLRHVSFISDERSRTVAESHGLGDQPQLAARLDVRRNSIFDVAAGVAPVLMLNEHFRSAPHLVEFVARRLYRGQVTVATRSPGTQSVDCVQVVRLEGRRDKAGVVGAEVDWIRRTLADLLEAGKRSVGVVTPFRAQADAIEEAVLADFTADDLERLDLRVGTVHAFQGNERDLILASVGVGTDDSANSWRFVEDPHLFAVFVTRAREQLTFLVSGEPPTDGLVADYLAQVDSPPGQPDPVEGTSPWAAGIAKDLVAAGLPATTGYPTGRHVLDVCVGGDGGSAAVECDVHPDGPEAHVDRHLALRRGGWDLWEAHRSRWSDRQGELVVELVNALSD